MTRRDYTKLLTREFYNNDVWKDFFTVISDILEEEVNDVTDLLAKIREPDVSERLHNASTARMLGFDHYSDKFADDDYKRIIRFIGLYNKKKGTKEFADFMGFILNTRFTVTPLWSKLLNTNQYDQFVYKGTAKVAGTIFDTVPSDYFPTAHIELSYDQGTFPITDEASIVKLFYQLAPANLVIDSIIAAYNFLVYNLYLAPVTITEFWEWTLPNDFTYNSVMYWYLNNFQLYEWTGGTFTSYLNLNDHPVTTPISTSTFRRNSRGEYEDIGGSKQLQVGNTLRLDYRLGVIKGWLIEQEATNMITGAGAPADQNILFQPGTYTMSCRTGSVTVGAYGTAVPGTPVTFTIPATSVEAVTIAGSTAPQIETGSSATSFHNTSLYPIRRKDELVYEESGWLSYLYWSSILWLDVDTNLNVEKTIAHYYNPSTGNEIRFYREATTGIIKFKVTVSAVTTTYVTTGVWTTGLTKIGIRRHNKEITIWHDGVRIFFNTSMTDLPVTTNAIMGGDRTGTTYMNGWIQLMLNTDIRYEDPSLLLWTT